MPGTSPHELSGGDAASGPVAVVDGGGDARSDEVYTWVIRGAYLLSVGLTCWYLWEAVKELPGTQIKIARAQAWVRVHLRECEGCAQRKATLRRAVNRMHWQAERIVSEAADERRPAD
jgi:hypothetical protein